MTIKYAHKLYFANYLNDLNTNNVYHEKFNFLKILSILFKLTKYDIFK